LVVAAKFAAVDVLVVFAQQGERWTSTGESDSFIGRPEHREVELVDVGDVTQLLARDIPAGSLQFDYVGAHPGQVLSARRSRLPAFERLSHDVLLNSYIVRVTIPGAYTAGSSHGLIGDDGLP
jgi:hypothetical protein